MILEEKVIAIWLTVPNERIQELCPGEFFGFFSGFQSIENDALYQIFKNKKL